MNLKSKSDFELITETKSLSTQERELKAKILHYLKEIDCRRIYLERGYSSLFAFCMGYLGYTEAEAQRRISACRLLKELPEIEAKIESGELSLTAISQAQSYFKAEAKNDRPLDSNNKLQVLTRLENKSTRECERELIKMNPQALPIYTERKRVIADNHIELKVILDSKTAEKLEKIKNLCPDLDLPGLIDKMADLMLLKKDILRKKERSQKGPVAREVTRYISAATRREVWRRDNQECQYLDKLTGHKCKTKYRLQIDHIHPFAKGGGNELNNLQLLCAGHNRLRAIKEFGIKALSNHP